MSFISAKLAKTRIAMIKELLIKYSRYILATALCIATVISFELLNTSVKTFVVFDGSKTQTVHLLKDNVNAALCSVNLTNEDYEILSTEKKGTVTKVNIGYTFPVKIKIGENTATVKTSKATVAEILHKAGISLDGDDIVEPSADTVITKKATVKFSDISYFSGTYTEKIPCFLETVYSADREKGDNLIVGGADGERLVSYTTKTVNGKAVNTVVNSTVVLKSAVNGKQIVGTKAPKPKAVTTSAAVQSVSALSPDSPIGLDANGNPVNYTKKITVQATAYTYTGKRCSTGVAPKPGYIAVNPNVIPYGTKMYIKTPNGGFIYGYAVAADTGGFTKSRPNNVDLFMSTRSACTAFGRQNVDIYFIG